MGQAGCKNIEQGPRQFLLRTAFGLAGLSSAGNVTYTVLYCTVLHNNQRKAMWCNVL